MAETSLEKAFQIFELLESGPGTVSAEDVGAALGASRSTTYRYLKALCETGFLMHVSPGRYALGPRIVELERRLQLSDPLLNAGRPPMEVHADACPTSALILCGLWGERVLCLHQADSADGGVPSPKLRRARGQPFPLFKGAASLSILASLPLQKLRTVHLRHAHEIALHGQGADWPAFRSAMQAIRTQGYARTSGAFRADLVAYAMPLRGDDETAFGSITRIMPLRARLPEAAILSGLRILARQIQERLAERVRSAARDETQGALQSVGKFSLPIEWDYCSLGAYRDAPSPAATKPQERGSR